jgi:hypothetical protein
VRLDGPRIRPCFGNIVSGVFTPVLAMATDFSATLRRRVVIHPANNVSRTSVRVSSDRLP